MSVFSEPISDYLLSYHGKKETLVSFVPEENFYAQGQSLIPKHLQNHVANITSNKGPVLKKVVPWVHGSLKNGSGDPTSVLFNFDHGKKRRPAWIPSNLNFAKINSHIIELTSLNPYTLEGKIILVLDEDSFLPLYKIVYDRRGNIIKNVIALWSKSPFGTPLLSSVISLNADGSEASVYNVHLSHLWSFEDSNNEASVFLDNFVETLSKN